MGRLVDAVKKPHEGALASMTDNRAKDYLQRVAKYVPGEVIAAYLAINGFLISVPQEARIVLLLINFFACLVLTPIYLAQMAEANQPKCTHLIVATVAFVVWAYTVSGDSGIFGMSVLNWYNSGVASALLVLFSLISGVIVPKFPEE